MDWIINDNVIVGKDDNGFVIPDVKEIFQSSNTISVGEREYDFEISGIRFSKLLALNVQISFSLANGRILSKFVAIKRNTECQISKWEGKYLGYVIVDDTWHYLNSDYDVISEVYKRANVDPNGEIEYFKYIEITNALKQQGIEYDDAVLSEIDGIKNTVSETNASDLNNILFPYQKTGTNWLNFMSDGDCGCILGDEMGLGKTLQVIALLDVRKKQNENAHFLVVSPLSLLVNWKREIEKFCPSLSTHIHHGASRTGFYEDLLKYDVVITSYGNIQSDLSMFKMVMWDMLILDEAQSIKNPKAKRRKCLNELNRRMSVAITGTPFENHVSDIWSISDFVIPGYLGTLNEFENEYEDNLYSAQEIEHYLSPIMIRRRVKDVAKDLPEKIEIPQPIIMSDEEAEYYENERNEYVGKTALNQVRIDLIQGLRMFCSHPTVYRDDLNEVDPLMISNKYRRTCEILEEIISYGEKALIFTSFNKMSELFCRDLPARFGIKTLYINGKVDSSERQSIIDEFSAIEGPAVLVLNPKAAGAGLNITCANHVIHYNLEWNPAIESQASARAYRRGQEKTVFIYRLYYTGTIEEFVNEKIENKQEIFNAAVVGNKGDTSTSDLIMALGYSPRKETVE